ARPRLGARHGRVTVGPVLSVRERWQALAPADGPAVRPADRPAARRLIADLGDRMRHAFEQALI
ncbi:MAG: hypothetical protein VKI81_07900, partial [Synechococcaceae cyanobacterium]|nr:hypothetical protein [Synechococcaceae cyanobacterium]